MAHELAPGYSEANEATQASLGVTFDTLASLSDLTNGFVGFFVFLASMGIAILLRRSRSAAELAPAVLAGGPGPGER